MGILLRRFYSLLRTAVSASSPSLHGMNRPGLVSLSGHAPRALQSKIGSPLSLASSLPSGYSPVSAPGLDRRSVHAAASRQGPAGLPPGVERLIEKLDIEHTFSRSGGAGGQNVNKVSTKADIRLDLNTCRFLSEEVKEAVRRREANRVTKEGVLVVKSEVHRTQFQNLDDALDRMNDMVVAAARSLIVAEPTPEKKKRIRALSRAYDNSRLNEKKAQARKKSVRGRPVGDD